MKRTINILKVSRLMISILIIITIVFYLLVGDIYALPSEDLIMALLFSFFVFLLGFQYHIEKKQGNMALFLMLFAVVMAIMSVVGFLY